MQKKKQLISKALRNAIDDHNDFIWAQDHLNNIFLCRVKFHENGREIFKKFASFYLPDELDKALELHHAVFDAVREKHHKPMISSVLRNLVWKGIVDPGVLAKETERERM